MILSENLYELTKNSYNNENQENIFNSMNIKKKKNSFDNLAKLDKLDNINENSSKEITSKKQKYNDALNFSYLINTDVKFDNLLCSYCVNGDVTNTIFLIVNKGVDPFKYNELYNTNPINLAFKHGHLNIIKIVQKYVYDKKIPYEFNFYCPHWGTKQLNPGDSNYQPRIFQNLYNTITYAFWSLELNKWVKF
jgi:hypothetical protein